MEIDAPAKVVGHQ